MSESDEMLALATKFFDGIEKGDVSILRQVYAPNVEIWHNTDNAIQTLDDNVKTLEGMVSRISERKYDNRRIGVFPGGFVQQHLLTGRRKDGVKVSLHACIVCQVKNGRITRLDEYFDSAGVAEFRKGAS